jgi:hypothetical protein
LVKHMNGICMWVRFPPASLSSLAAGHSLRRPHLTLGERAVTVAQQRRAWRLAKVVGASPAGCIEALHFS